ncbi:MAG: glycosyltransferase family 4 protein [Planctomycetes bacterium]|nr:glycosyltransferase family 4 protein [Planctomycetota bacterium]MBI3833221.1 glycosyltransferase family 4 protein [Planctomycetota bacterium]
MKIALVSEWMDAWRGGAETSTLQFLHHLMDRGVEVHLFTRSRPASAPGLQVHSINTSRLGRALGSGSFVRQVEEKLHENSFDIVHAITPCPSADIYQPRGGTVAETIARNVALREYEFARKIKRFTGRLNFRQQFMLAQERELFAHVSGVESSPGTTRFTPHGPPLARGEAMPTRSQEIQESPSTAFDRPIVVAISKYVARQLKEHYRLPDDRIRLIYNGVNADDSTAEQRAENRARVRQEYGIEDRELLVLQVAHNFRLKGVQTWMRALSILKHREVAGTGKEPGLHRPVRSLLIGRGETARWHRLAEQLGIQSVLTFVGSTNRIQQFYHAADVLVHPTYYDPCSRVVLEAMASGVPAVTTPWDGASEMIENGKNGFILDDPSNADMLASTVEMLADANLRKSVGEAAREVREKVSMARHTEQMLELYAELMDHPSRISKS